MVNEGFVEVTGGKVWYQIHGKELPGDPVIVLHGGPGSSHYSLQGLKALAKDRPVIFYDQLGCGYSDRPSDHRLWHIDRFVEELAELRKALVLENLHILGHSWGTTLAAAYMLTKPTGIKSVVFSSPCLSAPLWAEDQERNRQKLPQDVQEILRKCEELGATDSEEYRAATMEFNQQFVCRINPWPEFLKKGAHMKNSEVYQTMWGPSEFYVTGNLKNFDCTSRLHEIAVPTLYTCGRFDEATPESTRYFSDLTPASKFHVFEHSAHMPYLEEPEEFLRVIKAFLNE